MLALAACAGGAGDAPELLRVRSLVPDALVAGSTVRLQGEGFPIARDGQIHFHGECTSPGERARLIDVYRRYRMMPPERRMELRQRFRELSPEQRQILRERRLRQLRR